MIETSGMHAGSRGLLKLGARLRPFISTENGQLRCLESCGQDVLILEDSLPRAHPHAKKGPFHFDYAIDSTEPSSLNYVSNEDCYQLMCKRMVLQAFDGHNSCFICYGHSGTGKSWTIFGDERSEEGGEKGILHYLLKDIFSKTDRLEEKGCVLDVKVAFVEIYNETISDLLDESSTVTFDMKDACLKLVGASEYLVTPSDECLQLIIEASARRTKAVADTGKVSNRGHAVFIITMSRCCSDGSQQSASIYLADLAGHANEKTTKLSGRRLQELQFINKSLMSLQIALRELTNERRVDVGKFRSSKLTMVLAPCLVGTASIAFVLTLSPALDDFDANYESLIVASALKNLGTTQRVSAQSSRRHSEGSFRFELRDLSEQVEAMRNHVLTVSKDAAVVRPTRSVATMTDEQVTDQSSEPTSESELVVESRLRALRASLCDRQARCRFFGQEMHLEEVRAEDRLRALESAYIQERSEGIYREQSVELEKLQQSFVAVRTKLQNAESRATVEPLQMGETVYDDANLAQELERKLARAQAALRKQDEQVERAHTLLRAELDKATASADVLKSSAENLGKVRSEESELVSIMAELRQDLARVERDVKCKTEADKRNPMQQPKRSLTRDEKIKRKEAIANLFKFSTKASEEREQEEAALARKRDIEVKRKRMAEAEVARLEQIQEYSMEERVAAALREKEADYISEVQFDTCVLAAQLKHVSASLVVGERRLKYCAEQTPI